MMTDYTKDITAIYTAFDGTSDLKSWWGSLISEHGRYAVYGFYLALPMDSEARRYARRFGKELDLLSSKDCLIIGLGKDEFMRFDNDSWARLIDSKEGQSHAIKIADLYGMDYTEIPCLLLFEEFNSSEYVIINLGGLSAEEIGYSMREIFSVIRRSASKHKSPLQALVKMRHKDVFIQAGSTIISGIRSTATKTFQVAVEAWLDSVIR